MQPDVTVIIPCYNCEKWISQAIQSCLDQEGTEVEIIVVNDGSTDRSVDIIRTFGARVRSINQQNKGVGAARNAGALFASGRYCKFLDADDLLPRNCLAELVLLADKVDGSAVIGNYEEVDEHGNTMSLRNYGYPLWVTYSGLLSPTALLTQATSVSLLLFPRSMLNGNLRFPEDIRLGEEYDFFYNFVQLGFQAYHTNISVSIIRNHSGPRLSRTAKEPDCRSQLLLMVECIKMLKLLNTSHSQEASLLLSRRIWALGRDCLRNGLSEIANDCFVTASRISGRQAITGRIEYRLLAATLGPRLTESFLVFLRKTF